MFLYIETNAGKVNRESVQYSRLHHGRDAPLKTLGERLHKAFVELLIVLAFFNTGTERHEMNSNFPSTPLGIKTDG